MLISGYARPIRELENPEDRSRSNDFHLNAAAEALEDIILTALSAVFDPQDIIVESPKLFEWAVKVRVISAGNERNHVVDAESVFAPDFNTAWALAKEEASRIKSMSSRQVVVQVERKKDGG